MAHQDLLSTIRGEIDARLAELRPLLAEHEQLLAAVAALDVSGQATPTRTTLSRGTRQETARVERSRLRRPDAQLRSKQPKAARGAAREAILAALEHGSHTLAELALVTAMSGPNIRNNLGRLLSDGAIAKTEREGKLAYALPG